MKRFLLIFVLLGFANLVGFAQIKPLSINDLDKRIDLGKDTTFIINFWATWCSPCIEELPYFEKVNINYQDDKIKVLLVSLDFKSKLESNVKPFLKRMKLKSEVFILDEPNQQTFIDHIYKDWSGAIPATLFVNKQLQKRKFFEQEFTFEQLETTLKMFRDN